MEFMCEWVCVFVWVPVCTHAQACIFVKVAYCQALKDTLLLFSLFNLYI